MNGTIDDLRLFAAVVQAGSFSGAGRRLGLPKQTLSRRVAELEARLRVQLLHRTTRRLSPTQIGAAYAARAAEIVRLAEEADRAVGESRLQPTGRLRVTADPVFGEAHLGSLVIEYARRFPEVEVEVLLTRRRVNLIEEGFDVAFRIGAVEDSALTAIPLAPARVRYCASPAYLRKQGRPRTPEELGQHQCLIVDEMARWPVRGPKGLRLVGVNGRLRFNSFALAREAALAGLGILIAPEFACQADLRAKRLVSLLEEVEVGAVYLAHPTARYLSERVRSFVDLAARRLAPPRR